MASGTFAAVPLIAWTIRLSFSALACLSGAVDKVCFQKYGLAKSSSNSIYFTVNNNKQARK
ncbi:MAG: hypothetical protein E7E26_03405, partial [Clostridiales bacterium]|nr:hypothetical protein [Clostridiales bacterium]